jgi:hypothetical protein
MLVREGKKGGESSSVPNIYQSKKLLSSTGADEKNFLSLFFAP